MSLSQEGNTKERILDSAIDLFSEKGFFETSVREIAERSQIKVSSLYSHFSSKEEILDLILDYYQKELVKVRIPDEKLDLIIDNYSLEDILANGFVKIIETTVSPRLNKIIRILVMELYRNSKVREFYKQWYFNENRDSIIKIFEKMREKGTIKEFNMDLLASLYHALVNYYYHEYFMYILDNKDPHELQTKIEEHLRLFVKLLK